MHKRALLAGIAIWIVGTIVFRLGGPGMVHAPGVTRTIPGYVVNALIAGAVVQLLFRLLRIPPASWPEAVTLYILPTLLLDAFTTAFFPRTFPNLDVAAAPTFGGLMLVSIGGAVVSAWLGAYRAVRARTGAHHVVRADLE